MTRISHDAPGRNALSTLIAAVTLQTKTGNSHATERRVTGSLNPIIGNLKRSYRRSKGSQEATMRTKTFGFAWTRVAELEFSFGRVPEAKKRLNKDLPSRRSNPAGHSLKGFLLSAETR